MRSGGLFIPSLFVSQHSDSSLQVTQMAAQHLLARWIRSQDVSDAVDSTYSRFMQQMDSSDLSDVLVTDLKIKDAIANFLRSWVGKILIIKTQPGRYRCTLVQLRLVSVCHS